MVWYINSSKLDIYIQQIMLTTNNIILRQYIYITLHIFFYMYDVAKKKYIISIICDKPLCIYLQVVKGVGGKAPVVSSNLQYSACAHSRGGLIGHGGQPPTTKRCNTPTIINIFLKLGRISPRETNLILDYSFFKKENYFQQRNYINFIINDLIYFG